MCQLLAMSANTPTDIRFSFAALRLRGGQVGPHRDGFGLGLYRSQGLMCFHDDAAASDSEIAQLLQQLPLKAMVAIGHIRQANVGEVNLANTHPFVREWRGQQWCFAHNGQLSHSEQLAQGFYQAVGTTDSERAFCWLLSQLRSQVQHEQQFWPTLVSGCRRLSAMGVFNMMLSNGDDLYAFCGSQLHSLTRQAPFGRAQLRDCDLQIDFQQHTLPTDLVTILATEPLTADEQWQALPVATLQWWRQGQLMRSQSVAQ